MNWTDKQIEMLMKSSVVTVKDEDMINGPSHYKSHPSGVECITITEHMNFNLGNALKYIWRSGLKSDNAIEDLKKAEFYIKREISRLDKTNESI